MTDSLTNKQRAFIEAYLSCWNATEAARQAEYAEPNKQGPRLLVHVGIQAEIQRRLNEKALSADEVLARLSEHARGDIRAFIRWGKDGEFAGIRLREDQPTHLIKKLKPTKFGYEIELHDPQAALLHLAKHHGLLTDVDFTKIAEVIVQFLAQGGDISELRRLAKQSAQ